MISDQEKLKYVCAITLRYISRNHSLFDDVVQEGLLGFAIAEKVWSDTPGGMPALACGRKWVCGRIFNTFRNSMKHSREMSLNEYDAIDESQAVVSEALNHDALLARLHVALICLTVHDRKLINLSYFSDTQRTQLENAQIMGLPETTYYNRLRRAKQRLRSLMDEHGPCEIYSTT